MRARLILLISVLLLWANAAFAGGAYQRTKDGKTTVWNDRPKPGDAASWTGSRDREGYATGFGTLTWYSEQGKRPSLYARYFGNMVQGKFEGPVNAHSKGKTAHALFTDGARTSRWASGPAPSRNLAGPKMEPAREEIALAEAETPKHPSHPPPPPPSPAKSEKPDLKPFPTPAETPKREESVRPPSPPPTEPAAPPSPSPRLANKSRERPAAKAPSPGKPKSGMNESLRALVGPPSALRPNSVPDAPPAPAPVSSPPPSAPPVSSSGSAPGSNPPLTRDEVIDLADTVARAHGYDLNSYQRSGTEYHEPDDTWSLTYEKPADTASERGKHFSVTVDNRTKKAAVVPGD